MAPWKCEDCGAWWAGLEHRCAPTTAGNGTNFPPPCPPWYPPNWTWPPYVTTPVFPPYTGTMTVQCTCKEKNTAGLPVCLLHDVRVWS